MAQASDPLRFDYPVASAEDVIAVVARLRAILAERPDEWQNWTLDGFLDGIGAWLESFPSSEVDLGYEVPSEGWRLVADLLRVGRIYE